MRPLGVVALVALLLCACIAHRQYRTEYEACRDAASPHCPASALHLHDQEAEDGYALGFVELDDQGQLWDRAQMWAVLGHLQEAVASDDLLVVVFVHGWKHSAAPDDENVELFRRNLALLSRVEARISRDTGVPRRRVAGIYLGWRGGSVSLPVLKELTFWSRKSTAHEVGRNGAAEVLVRTEELKALRHAVAPASDRTCVVLVGHSFGGGVLYSALADLLQERFVLTEAPRGAVGSVRGFGDLVVLINPAFEALQYATLRDMAAERGTYFSDQLPVLAVLTSESDDATEKAFPVGRFFSTLFEREREVERPNGHMHATELVDQTAANRTALGHFDPYRTHRLDAAPVPEPEDMAGYMAEEFYALSESWEQDRPGASIRFPGSVLTRRDTTAERNPYLVIRVDDEIIPDHGHIDDLRVLMFLQQLILLSAQDKAPEARAETRTRGAAAH